ncbi:hypothetical protein I2I11_20790 [Pontibacter sp. 172403-2]|uniref:hypothetical protein n=1 Tax=Pontibacter rufus TaxID=2791028 RepID=UPI0018AF5E93|nr:hypothetical protein [Pontibacter sp. 172403-2]MBF9255748.1 hypothetical protein [Pontibacter sp. 172403-2]
MSYVEGDFLFFAFYRHVAWHFEGEGETRDNVTEKRFYIIGGKPLQCLEKNFSFTSPASADMRSRTAANRETDCSMLRAVLDSFKSLAKYRSQEKYPDCLGE